MKAEELVGKNESKILVLLGSYNIKQLQLQKNQMHLASTETLASILGLSVWM